MHAVVVETRLADRHNTWVAGQAHDRGPVCGAGRCGVVGMDADRGVSVQQVFDQGQGQSRTCHYTNIKVNQALVADAFTFKTDKETRFITQ